MVNDPVAPSASAMGSPVTPSGATIRASTVTGSATPPRQAVVTRGRTSTTEPATHAVGRFRVSASMSSAADGSMGGEVRSSQIDGRVRSVPSASSSEVDPAGSRESGTLRQGTALSPTS